MGPIASRARRACAAALLGLWLPSAAAQSPTQPVVVEGPQYFALVDLERFEQHAPGAVQRGVHQGQHRFLLRSNALYRLYKLDARTLRVGFIEFRSGRDGERFTIPPVPLRPQSLVHDQDGDGLSDVAEFVVGTDPTNPSTAGDGILDSATVQAGTLNLPLLRTGVIASVRLPGTAQDVAALNDMAVVALGQAGVAVANVFTRMNPEVVAWVDTPGEALRVAVTGSLVAVADGAAGLAVVDVSDPPAARIIRQVTGFLLGGRAECVTALAGIALVGLSTGELVTVDLASGAVLERVRVGPRPLVDVTVSGDAIYALDGTTLHALPLTLGRLSVASSVASPFFAAQNARVTAGGGVAYVVHGKGVNTFNLSSPLQPSLIQATNTTQFGWKELALDGTGLALAAVSPNQAFDGPHHVSLYDVRDPVQTNVFLAEFPTPGVARSVGIFNGLCYVADHTAGLQVVNYLPQDRAGMAPTITLSTNQPVATVCEEGALLRISAVCQDDVAVRNCELFVNGLRTETDGSFPFEFFLVTPRLTERERISVRVRVSDTGGNSAFSDELVIDLVPDGTPPEVTRLVPSNGGLLGQLGTVAAFFNEPIDPASLTPGAFRVIAAGPDALFGTADDVLIAGTREVREQLQGAFFTPIGGDLPPGRYRAELTSDVRDVAGNPLTPVTWHFLVYGGGLADTDGDGLPDLLELELGLDPNNPDTNGNGVRDGDEDFSGGGVPNWVKVVLGWDLRSTDTDGNGIPDALEDRDQDRLPDWREVVLGTDPFNPDTDGDGFTDNDEVLRGSDPLDPARVPLRSAFVATTIRNLVDPGHRLGRALVGFTVRNHAAPEAASGSTQARPTSVQNQAP
ncbi:MAG: Ig-like domain-containing protein [Planctomycetota bacterium]|nr:Ig-like domain-containing protein [Planctomycetota bacterium]